jgi:hypothetical protein
VILAVSAGAAAFGVGASRAEALAPGTHPLLAVGSWPDDAEIWLDGRASGRTPVDLAVAAGPHRVQLKAPHAVETEYAIDVDQGGAAFEPLLWRRQPLISRVHSTLPGASLSGVHLLPDGRVSLMLGVGPDQQLQAWQLDVLSGAQAPLLTGAAGSRLSLAADGVTLAYVGREIGPVLPSHAIPDQVVWLAAETAPLQAPRALWHAPAGERLTDISWSPDGERLVAVTAHDAGAGAVRSRLWLIEPAPRSTRLLFTLPSRVVPGSLAWSPDGQRIALLAHAGLLNALCLVELSGEFRYLADLEPSSSEPLPYPPLTWSADSQQALFAAPRLEPPGAPAPWLQTESRRGLYLVDADAGAPRLVGDAEAALGAWREDGQIMTLVRSRDGTLTVGLIGADLRFNRLVDLPLKPAAVYAAEWDAHRARLLLASRSAGEVEYWLVQLGLADRP